MINPLVNKKCNMILAFNKVHPKSLEGLNKFKGQIDKKSLRGDFWDISSLSIYFEGDGYLECFIEGNIT